MNQHSPSDDNLPIQDGTRIEQQLKQMRPRGPQVDFNAIASASPGPAQLAASTYRENRFSTSQFVAATAASWILGAVVGGSCIFYAMKPSESQLARDTKAEMVIAEPPLCNLRLHKWFPVHRSLRKKVPHGELWMS